MIIRETVMSSLGVFWAPGIMLGAYLVMPRPID